MQHLSVFFQVKFVIHIIRYNPIWLSVRIYFRNMVICIFKKSGGFWPFFEIKNLLHGSKNIEISPQEKTHCNLFAVESDR